MIKKSKTVIFSLLDTPALGGAEQYLWDHLSHLAKQGYPVVVACNNQTVTNHYQHLIKTAHLKNFHVIPAPYRLDAIGNWKGLIKYVVGLPTAWWWLWHTLAELKKNYDRVICYWPGWSDRVSFSPIAKWLGCYLIWIEIGPLEPLFKRNWGFPRWLYRVTRDLPDALTATSEWTRQSIIKTGQIPPTKIQVLYPGINLISAGQLQTYRHLGQAWLKKNHGAQTLIGWVGRLARENELEILLQAIAKLKNPPAFKVAIIGAGPDLTYYQELATHLKVDHLLVWTGFISVTEKFSILSVCDAFVFTRAWDLDGFGMTTIEAMSVGVPVITSQFGPQLEIVTSEKNGLLFKPHQPVSLARQLDKLLSDPPLRQKLGRAAQETVQTFKQDQTLSKLDRMLQEL